MKHYKHLLGSFKIGEIEQAIKLAKEQFSELVKCGELNKGEQMAYVQIEVYLIDGKAKELGDKKTEAKP